MIRKHAALIAGVYVETSIDCGPGRYRPEQVGRHPDSTGERDGTQCHGRFRPRVAITPFDVPVVTGVKRAQA